MWEWRPAFLTRSQQQGARTPVASSQPYTVLAKATDSLIQGVQELLEASGVDALTFESHSPFHVLGTRGIGLASLLTMGHNQSMGALGFYMAFKALGGWEASASQQEIRCIVPMDAIYPLINALAINAEDIDDQKRADLLLLKMCITSDGKTTALFHPVEIKARSRRGRSVSTAKQYQSKRPSKPVEVNSESYRRLEY